MWCREDPQTQCVTRCRQWQQSWLLSWNQWLQYGCSQNTAAKMVLTLIRTRIALKLCSEREKDAIFLLLCEPRSWFTPQDRCCLLCFRGRWWLDGTEAGRPQQETSEWGGDLNITWFSRFHIILMLLWPENSKLFYCTFVLSHFCDTQGIWNDYRGFSFPSVLMQILCV